MSLRKGSLWVGLVLAGVVSGLPTPEGLPYDAQLTAAVAVLMAVWWVFDSLPRAVTSLVPLVAFPVMGIQTLGVSAASYAHPLLYLMLGGFVMGAAMERVGLHERLVALVLQPHWIRINPRRILAALMLATAGLSGLVSNTATTLMLLPLAVSLGRGCDSVPAFVLGLAYAASIGGMSTLIGTPPNAVLAGMSPDLAGVEIGFAGWLLVGIPAVLLLLPAAWWVLTRMAFEVPESSGAAADAPTVPAWREGEQRVLWIVVGAFVLWLARAEKDLGVVTLPGWGPWFDGKGSELDAGVAMLTAIVLFAVPLGRNTLTWREVESSIPWGVLLLLGGGFSLAGAVASSGLTAWIASGADAVAGWPTWLTVSLICTAITFVTELTSNTATTQIALPLLAEAATRAGVAPLAWMIPATLSASCAFMMPVATAPNAIAAEAGGVSTADMVRGGLVLNMAGVAVLTVIGVGWVPWAFGLVG
ncbi:MAG: SLC13 family permease [Myxococcota bacterium]